MKRFIWPRFVKMYRKRGGVYTVLEKTDRWFAPTLREIATYSILSKTSRNKIGLEKPSRIRGYVALRRCEYEVGQQLEFVAKGDIITLSRGDVEREKISHVYNPSFHKNWKIKNPTPTEIVLAKVK